MARYKPSNKAKVVFCTSISNTAAPTQAELSAGTALCTPGTYVAAGLKEMQNFESKTNFIGTPDAAQDFDSQIPGRKSAGNPAIVFYDDDASTTIRTALAEGTAGYVVKMPYGQVSTKRCEVYPVTVGALNDSQVNSDNAAYMFTVDFAITSAPVKTAVVTA